MNTEALRFSKISSKLKSILCELDWSKENFSELQLRNDEELLWINNKLMKTEHPEAAALLKEKFKLLSAEERVEMATTMFDLAKSIIIDSLRNKNPLISESEIESELLFRFYGIKK
jgi:hypothetical protein